MKKIRIAILGANSHIAKGLIYKFNKNNNVYLYLYSTNKNKLNDLFNFMHHRYYIYKYFEFNNYNYDVIINCIGVGSSNKLKENYNNFFTFPEYYDNLCIEHLKENKNCLYITFSSGAVYGMLNEAANYNSENNIKVNQINEQNYYTITRLYTEAKHRSYKDLNIVDLRVFSYFSKFMDFEDKYFITELIYSILNEKEFKVVNDSFIRDYLHLDDLFQAIMKCIKIKKLNCALDIVSKKPIEKNKILEYYNIYYNLKYKYEKDFKYNSASGIKNIYYSEYDKAKKEIDYKPKYTSMETLIDVSKNFLEKE